MKRLETLRKALTHAMRESSDKQAHHYNLRRRDVEFQEGDLVLRRTHPLSNAAKHFSAALVPPFEGPFMINRKITNTDTPVPRAEDAAPAVDLTESTPSSSPPGQGVKEEPSLLTSQQRAARNAEIALESILFPEGIPVELDDLALPDDSDADVAQDPPPRGPLSPVVVLERLPLPGRPEGPQSQPAREGPIYLQDYWDPVRPWLSEIRSIEERRPGFAAALHTCTLTPAHHLSAIRFIIPPIPLELVSGTVPLGGSEEELPEATSEGHISERALAPPAHPTVEIGSSSASSSSSSSSSCSSCSRCSSKSGNSTIRSPGPAGDPAGDPATPRPSEGEGPDSTPAPSIQSAATEFIDLGPLEELSLPSTVPASGSPPPALSHPETELATPHPPPTDPRAGEKTPPHPLLRVGEGGEKLPEVTPLGSGRAFAVVATRPSISAPASTSACTQVGPSAPLGAVEGPVITSSQQMRETSTDPRDVTAVKRGGGQPRGTAAGKRRRPRHWCFDCRRHGHTHQACPNPTGELFCGQCPHRLRADKICPEHGPITQPAGGRTAGSSNTPAGTSQVRPPLPPASAAPSRRPPTAARSPLRLHDRRAEEYWAPFERAPIRSAAAGPAYPFPREEDRRPRQGDDPPEDSELRFFWQPPAAAPTSHRSDYRSPEHGDYTSAATSAPTRPALGRGANARFGPPPSQATRWSRHTIEALQSILDQAQRDQQQSPEP
ncbi:nascent polypeptide-associated complex subunit alpha, muscle-specific form-like, partial [Fopius arisanus]|uniref:Nascent polypeptide-associated complex subunit alpha, muscle-specific form-like n=1 Tax=Fopius arisanus TaxID=64838 RepID=A0A9R1TPV0_9HYME